MTGATAVIRFRGLRRKQRRSDPVETPVVLKKPDNLAGQREALRAVRESTDRGREVSKQRGAVAHMTARLAEIRKRNHLAEGIRAAMGGDEA